MHLGMLIFLAYDIRVYWRYADRYEYQRIRITVVEKYMEEWECIREEG